MFLLDTNVISELRKAGDGRADRNVLAWFSQFEVSLFYIPAIALRELETGVLLIERRDAVQGARLRTWMTNYLLPQFRDRVLPVDAAVALRCAALHVPDPKPEADALIAATALEHGMTVVTRNVADFERTGVPLVNPWLA